MFVPQEKAWAPLGQDSLPEPLDDAEVARDRKRAASCGKPETAMHGRADSNISLRHEPACSAEIVLEALRGRWTIHILKCIADQGAPHFGGLKRAIPGVSSKVLTDRVRHLEQAGILQRHPKPALRPEMLYSLTSRGLELKAVLDNLKELGARWQREDTSKADWGNQGIAEAASGVRWVPRQPIP